MSTRATTFACLFLLGSLAAACGGGATTSLLPAGVCGPAEQRFTPVKVEAPDGRPPIALVVRDGDPRPAIALVVGTRGGSAPAVGLSALIEQRLQSEGWTEIQTTTDGQGFRLAISIEEPDRIAAFVTASHKALGTPVQERSPEIRKAIQRLGVLADHPWGSDALAGVASCTGELGMRAAATAADLAEPRVALDLERWRKESYALERIAFGATGPDEVGRALTAAVIAQQWPQRTRTPDPWPSEDSSGVYPVSSNATAKARVDLALWVSDAEGAAGAAHHIGQAPHVLTDRLAALPVPFRLLEVAGVARLRGACLSAKLESARPLAVEVEAATARATVVARQELEQELAHHGRPDRGGSTRSVLAGHAAGAARLTADPREAAARAAWWALADRGASGDPSRVAIAVGVAAPTLDPRSADPEIESSLDAMGRRFRAALAAAEGSLRVPAIQHRERVEQGQGELWVLVATPCGTASETSADAGETALAALAHTVQHGPETPTVAIEPWITPDAVGLVAHAPRLRDEAPDAHAVRVAEAAAQAFFPSGIDADALGQARARLLDGIGLGVADEGSVFTTAAGALAPTHPSWLAPLGSWEGVFHAGAEGLSLRWHAIVEGPLRAAVLANDGPTQAEAAIRTIDRWVVNRAAPSQACPATAQAFAPRAGMLRADLRGVPPYAQAMIAAPAPGPDKRERYWFELTAAMLGGPAGLLRQSLGSINASASARLVGGQRAAALVIDIRAPEAVLESAVAQVTALLRKMRQGGLGAADLERAAAALSSQRLEARFDPRRRLAELWADRGSEGTDDPRLSLETWRGWVASGLAEDRWVVVLGTPKR